MQGEVGPETQRGPLALRHHRSAISSASLVWSPGCQTASAKKRLSKVQRLACLGIKRAIHMTPTAAIEARTGLAQLNRVIEVEARSETHRLLSLGC